MRVRRWEAEVRRTEQSQGPQARVLNRHRYREVQRLEQLVDGGCTEGGRTGDCFFRLDNDDAGSGRDAIRARHFPIGLEQQVPESVPPHLLLVRVDLTTRDDRDGQRTIGGIESTDGGKNCGTGIAGGVGKDQGQGFAGRYQAIKRSQPAGNIGKGKGRSPKSNGKAYIGRVNGRNGCAAFEFFESQQQLPIAVQQLPGEPGKADRQEGQDDDTCPGRGDAAGSAQEIGLSDPLPEDDGGQQKEQAIAGHAIPTGRFGLNLTEAVAVGLVTLQEIDGDGKTEDQQEDCGSGGAEPGHWCHKQSRGNGKFGQWEGGRKRDAEGSRSPEIAQRCPKPGLIAQFGNPGKHEHSSQDCSGREQNKRHEASPSGIRRTVSIVT